MERRLVLKGGMLLSAALLGDALLAPEPAEATVLACRFFEGVLDDGDTVLEWPLQLSVNGHRVQGIALDPNDASIGFRLRGRLRNNRLNLTVYDLADTDEEEPLGTVSGRNRGGSLRGSLSLFETKSKGVLECSRVELDVKSTRALAGTYSGAWGDDFGSLFATATIVVRRNGSFVLQDIEPGPDAPPDVFPPSRVAGCFGVDVDGRLWASILQVPAARRAARAAGIGPAGPGEPPGPIDPLGCFLCFFLILFGALEDSEEAFEWIIEAPFSYRGTAHSGTGGGDEDA